MHFLQQLPDSCPLQVTGLGSKETDYLVLWPNNFHVESLEDIAIDLRSTPQNTQPASSLQPEKASGNWTRKASERAHGSASRSGSQRAPVAVRHRRRVQHGSTATRREQQGPAGPRVQGQQGGRGSPGAGALRAPPRGRAGARWVRDSARAPALPVPAGTGSVPGELGDRAGVTEGRCPWQPTTATPFSPRQHLLLLHSQGPKNNPAFELSALVPSPRRGS